MTALSACIGLLPAAISTGIGSQVQRPLATVIVGGMLVGPVMLLLAVLRCDDDFPWLRQTPPVCAGGAEDENGLYRSVCLRGFDPLAPVTRIEPSSESSETRARRPRASEMRSASPAAKLRQKQILANSSRSRRRIVAPRACDESSPRFKRIFSYRKRPGDSEPNSGKAVLSGRRLPARNSCAIAQQCAPSQPQPGRHWRGREPEHEEYRRRSMGGKCIGGHN